MPYTFVHPGYAAWFKNKWFKQLSLNGLFFGSIVPDFDILFRLTNSRFHLLATNFITIFAILLPLSIVLSLIFHQWTKNTLLENLPNQISDRLATILKFNYVQFLQKHYKIEIVSILIAILLHFFLDYVSHWNAWYFKMGFHILIYPSVSLQPIMYYFGWYFPQLMATLIGVYLTFKYLIQPNFSMHKLKYYFQNWTAKNIVFTLTFLIIALAFALFKWVVFGYEGNGFGWHFVIIYITAGLVFSLFVTPILFKVRDKISNLN